jgi:hypothetical protein
LLWRTGSLASVSACFARISGIFAPDADRFVLNSGAFACITVNIAQVSANYVLIAVYFV